MADLVRHAVGVDLVEVALRQALGEDVPDEVALPRFSQPLAIRFLTASPGPAADGTRDAHRLPRPGARGRGRRPGGDLPQLGETIRPVRLDGDRRGYVIAVADTRSRRSSAPRPPRHSSRSRSEASAEGCTLRLSLEHYASCSRQPGRRLPVRRTSIACPSRATCSSATTSTSRSTRRSRMAELEAAGGRDGDVLPDDGVGLLQPRLEPRARAAIERLRELGHRVGLHAVYPHARARRALRPGASPGTTPTRSTCASPSRAR